MRTAALTRIIGVGFLAIAGLHAGTAVAQQEYTSSATTVIVKGTSTLHDWDMTSSSGKTRATFSVANGEIKGISALSFTVGAETLKSSRSGLDRNAYRALDTKNHKSISYKMTSGTVTKSGGSYTVKAKGTLTVAGSSKPLDITATATMEADGSIAVNGETKFAMTAYGVKPPTVMMGTIKTGDEITISYGAKLTK